MSAEVDTEAIKRMTRNVTLLRALLLLQDAMQTIDALMDNSDDRGPDDVFMAAGNLRDRIKDFLDGDRFTPPETER